MTNGEYLQRLLSRFGLAEPDVEMILLNQGVSPEEPVNIPAMKAALYKEFTSILPLANVSEGGYSITWNMEAVKLWYSQLARELGQENILESTNQDEINDASWRW